MPLLPTSSLVPYTTLFRSVEQQVRGSEVAVACGERARSADCAGGQRPEVLAVSGLAAGERGGRLEDEPLEVAGEEWTWTGDRKSTRLKSSHRCTSYAVFCV